MSVDFYDKAVTEKIKKVFSNTVFQERSLAFKTVTDTAGKVTFPYISIFRPDGWSISTKEGTWYEQIKFINGIQQIPIDLSYSIDIYANTREVLEQVTAELVFYLVSNRGVVTKYLSADETVYLTVKSQLEYVSGPDRTSELEDTTKGRPYRYTLVFDLNNAYIYKYADTEPDQGGEGYIPKVTEVLVKVIPELDVKVSAEGDTKVTKLIIEEEKN